MGQSVYILWSFAIIFMLVIQIQSRAHYRSKKDVSYYRFAQMAERAHSSYYRDQSTSVEFQDGPQEDKEAKKLYRSGIGGNSAYPLRPRDLRRDWYDTDTNWYEGSITDNKLQQKTQTLPFAWNWFDNGLYTKPYVRRNWNYRPRGWGSDLFQTEE